MTPSTDRPKVVNLYGKRAGDYIRAAFPQLQVIDGDVREPPPDDLQPDVVFGGYGNPNQVMRWLDGANWVHLPGTGIDTVAPAVFEGRMVTNSRGATAIPIAEYAMAAVYAFEKRIPEVWISEPPASWNLHRMGQLENRTMGILGLGSIGQALARRAIASDMHVLATRRSNQPSPVAGVELADADVVIKSADHLVLCLPGTSHTHHILDDVAFASMKPGVHVVNVARGSLIDQDALARALEKGTVAAATLDAVEPEPLPAGHWMYGHPHIRLSPHVSWCADTMSERLVRSFCTNLTRFLDGEPLLNAVSVTDDY